MIASQPKNFHKNKAIKEAIEKAKRQQQRMRALPREESKRQDPMPLEEIKETLADLVEEWPIEALSDEEKKEPQFVDLKP